MAYKEAGLVWLHMITFGVTAWFAYRKYRNVSFELTKIPPSSSNGRRSYNPIIERWLFVRKWQYHRDYERLAKNRGGSPTLKILTSLSLITKNTLNLPNNPTILLLQQKLINLLAFLTPMRGYYYRRCNASCALILEPALTNTCASPYGISTARQKVSDSKLGQQQ